LFCALMFVVGVTATGYMTTSMTVAQSAAAPEMRGRVAALLVMANQGTTPIGALVMGALMASIGARAAMALAGATAVVAGAALLAVEARRSSAAPVAEVSVPVEVDAAST
jgi:hypothetical protein